MSTEKEKSTMDSKEMIDRNAENGTVIRYGDRVKLEVIKDTRFYRKGQLINPHKVMAEQLVKDGICKEPK